MTAPSGSSRARTPPQISSPPCPLQQSFFRCHCTVYVLALDDNITRIRGQVMRQFQIKRPGRLTRKQGHTSLLLEPGYGDQQWCKIIPTGTLKRPTIGLQTILWQRSQNRRHRPRSLQLDLPRGGRSSSLTSFRRFSSILNF